MTMFSPEKNFKLIVQAEDTQFYGNELSDGGEHWR